MRTPSAAQSSLLLALVAGRYVAEGAKHRMIVRKYKTDHKIDWWDDGRAEPYRVKFSKFGLRSAYFFGKSGALRSLTVDDKKIKFSSDIGSRMLHAVGKGEDEQEPSSGDRHPPFSCPDCEDTWNKLCSVGLEDVCALHQYPRHDFDANALDSVRRMCTAFGAACETSAPDTCEGKCVPEEVPADACNPNPCQNGGSCYIDPAGGHLCYCASGYGGMACQTDTTDLAPFYIEIDFIGTWTDERKAVFQSAADRWSEVITHVPCGGGGDDPPGRLLINSTLEEIDGVGGTLGAAGPSSYWGVNCSTISASGAMTFDIDDIAQMEEEGTMEGVIMHEMGHVIGIGTLWGTNFGECTTCRETESPAWTCPATLRAYKDIGGSGNEIVEMDGGQGTACSHLDETLFHDELMTGYVNNVMYMSKMTAAVLDDLNYCVDARAVDPYTFPAKRESTPRGFGPSMTISDTLVDTIILALDDEGNVVDEVPGVGVVF